MTQTTTTDLTPVTRTLAAIVAGVRDEQLGAQTPCRDTSVGDLLDHVDGLALAFTAAAAKETADGDGPPPRPSAAHLLPTWRARIPERLAALATAWSDPVAWTGMTRAGGIDLPGEVAGSVAINEVVVHGWDIAVSTGQTFSCEPDLLGIAWDFVRSAVEQNPHGTPGLFGPPVPVPDDAARLDQLIGLTGRDPGWRPPSV